MHKFTRRLLTEWRRLDLPFADKKILIAVSGGADSCALALALSDLIKRKKFKHDFVIAHFNHGLRSNESDGDEDFTRELSADLGFKFVAGRAKEGEIDRESNTEQSARRARYAFFNGVAKKENCFGVITAHTVNDQAETFLLNLIRGSGIDGLTGMKNVRPLVEEYDNSHKNDFEVGREDLRLLIRPLLNWATRDDTERFVESCAVPYRQDEMNFDPKYTRIRIRTELIPKLVEFNPKIVQTLARTSDLLRNASEETNRTEFEIQMGEQLRLDELKKLPLPDLHKILRIWLKAQRGGLRRIGFAHIGSIEKLIHTRKSGRIVELPRGERVMKHAGFLLFRKSPVEK